MITSRPQAWDSVVDVIVMGSGAAGLTAATLAHDGGAEVLLLEKAPLIGGTTGVSGGMPWIPINSHLADVGVSDSREEALTYIRRLALGTEPDPALVETFVDTAPEMIDYLESKTPLRMTAPPGFSDYYADQSGGKPAGRSLEPAPFDARGRARRVGLPRAHQPSPAAPDHGGGRQVPHRRRPARPGAGQRPRA